MQPVELFTLLWGVGGKDCFGICRLKTKTAPSKLGDKWGRGGPWEKGAVQPTISLLLHCLCVSLWLGWVKNLRGLARGQPETTDPKPDPEFKAKESAFGPSAPDSTEHSQACLQAKRTLMSVLEMMYWGWGPGNEIESLLGWNEVHQQDHPWDTDWERKRPRNAEIPVSSHKVIFSSTCTWTAKQRTSQKTATFRSEEARETLSGSCGSDRDGHHWLWGTVAITLDLEFAVQEQWLPV